MPLPPATPGASPKISARDIVFGAQTLAADLTTELLEVDRDSYLTAARLLPVGAAAADPTNTRTWTLVDQTTLSITDGCIVDPAVGKGPWAVGTAYTAGQWVTLNNLMYVCISAVTGGTGPGVDTSHWQQIAAVGLNYVNTLSTAITSDFLGAAISDSGNTDVPASSKIGAVPSTQQALTGTTQETQPATSPSLTALTVSAAATAIPLCNAAGASVNGVAVVTRTCTIGASRTLATFAMTGSVSLAAGVETDLVLSTTDTKVYKGDVLKLVSTHNGTGVADPGGVIQVELTAYGEGTD